MIHEFTFLSGSGKKPGASTPTSARVTVILGRDQGLEELEARYAASATPIAAQFDDVGNSGWGIKQITAEGRNLLVGAGFGFIGSRPGVGDNENNISSASRHTSNGVMRPFNNNTQVGGYLPYSLNFSRDANDRSKVQFNGSVGGPNGSPFDFATLSMPMDSVRGFTYFRWSGASGVLRYDQNPFSYNSSTGPIHIKFAPGSPVWGEIIGVDYTIRVTMNSSRPLSLAFVEAPGLGVRNVEFGFIGGLPRGQKATVSGTIQTFRTDRALLPRMVFQAESYNWHQTGVSAGNAWVARAGIDPTNKYMSYGPYTTDVPAGDRVATFRLQIDRNTGNNDRVVTIEVFDANTGRVLPGASRTLYRRDFGQGMRYQDFDVKFTASAGQKLEFRTFWHGSATVWQDDVQVV